MCIHTNVRTVESLPKKLQGITANVVGGSLYVVGGYDITTNEHVDTTYTYESESWNIVDSRMLHPRSRHGGPFFDFNEGKYDNNNACI